MPGSAAGRVVRSRAAGSGRPLAGWVVVDKPSGESSRATLDRVGRTLRAAGFNTKTGHAGTLDPLATGVLVVAVGDATRLVEYVQRMPKTYVATILLGASSTTDDADGHVVAFDAPRVPSTPELEAALATQVGVIEQAPPDYSAVKIEGRRAYDLARSGAAVAPSPRPVEIHEIVLLDYAWPRAEIRVECGSGTYIRSIARDLGAALGCGGYIATLRRTRIGVFDLDAALDPRGLAIDGLLAALRPTVDGLGAMPRVPLDHVQVALVRQGRALDPHRLPLGDANPGELALIETGGALVAIADWPDRDQSVLPRKVLAAAESPASRPLPEMPD